MDLNKIIFKGKNFSDLLKDIYENHKNKDRQIVALINELRPLVTNIGDATLLVPLIKEYLDVGTKNDDQLIKLAQIIQKVSESEKGTDSLSETEKEELLKHLKNDNKTGPKSE